MEVTACDSCPISLLLAKNRVSNNVGAVKRFLSVLFVHSEECAISLSWKVLRYQHKARS